MFIKIVSHLFFVISCLTLVSEFGDSKKENMKVVIFGATGMTGLCAVEAAVKKGYEVRAVVRDPSKVPEHLVSKVEIFKGDVLDPKSVANAVEGTDAVVIVLGTRNRLGPTTDLSEGTRNILNAMTAKGVGTVSACVSAYLFYDEDMIPPRFIPITKDHKRMLEELKGSDVNWIAVLPPHITNHPSSDIIVKVNPEQSPGMKISKYDLGMFLVDSLTEPQYYKAIIGLSNVPKH